MMRWSILFAMAGCVAADVQPVVDLEDPVAVADISDPDTGASDTDEPSDPIVTETPLVSDCPSFPITEWIDPNRPFDATAVAPGDLLELFIKEGEPMWGQDMKALVITPSRDAEDTFVEIRVITDCGEHYVEGYWLSVI